VASPEIVTAFSIAGSLYFNPLKDKLKNEDGQMVQLSAPLGLELPPDGFEVENNGYQAPSENGGDILVRVHPASERLQLLKPFSPWDGSDLTNMRLLVKVKGKCTTDHISMAGPWLKYRGHLDNISNNLLIGSTNCFNNSLNLVKNHITGEYGMIPETARAYQAKGIHTLIVGDENYGEGSSREHAAMEPRYLGVKAVLVRSFARIHEANLKKQGMLALTFSNKNDYNKIEEDDLIDIIGLTTFEPGKPLIIKLKHSSGTTDKIYASHTYNDAQIEWFRAGSALNLIRQRQSGD
jgi:aconitate hydratase